MRICLWITRFLHRSPCPPDPSSLPLLSVVFIIFNGFCNILFVFMPSPCCCLPVCLSACVPACLPVPALRPACCNLPAACCLLRIACCLLPAACRACRPACLACLACLASIPACLPSCLRLIRSGLYKLYNAYKYFDFVLKQNQNEQQQQQQQQHGATAAATAAEATAAATAEKAGEEFAADILSTGSLHQLFFRENPFLPSAGEEFNADLLKNSNAESSSQTNQTGRPPPALPRTLPLLPQRAASGPAGPPPCTRR